MSVAAAAIRGASDIYAVGSRKNCAQLALEFGATDIINYRQGDIVEQIMEKTHGKGVDRIIVAGGDNDTFAQAIRMLKPGGIVANVNYLGSGDYVKLPRVEWGCGMAHKQIRGGLMPGGRLRTERLLRLIETANNGVEFTLLAADSPFVMGFAAVVVNRISLVEYLYIICLLYTSPSPRDTR